MNLSKKFKNIFKNKSPTEDTRLNSYLASIGVDLSGMINSQNSIETTYFICLKHLSETMAKMPWELKQYSVLKGKERIFDGRISKLLNLRPNPYQNATVFWASIELSRLHHGNSYIYIETDTRGKPKGLWQLPSEEVDIYVNSNGLIGSKSNITYVWSDIKRGKQYSFSTEELLHIKTLVSFDGIKGLATKDIIKMQLETSKESNKFLNRLYKNNMFGSKVAIQYDGDLNVKNEDKVAAGLERFSTSTKTGKFIPLPPGFKAQMLDMKLADAQFFENNKLNTLQIAAAFGIKPNMINDYAKSSYANSETQQIDFFVNTLQPLFLNYEQELTYKLISEKEVEGGKFLEVNNKVLFKMDSKTQADVYSKYLSNFGMTPNEFREEVGLPYIEGGDILIGNGNAIGLEDIGKQYDKQGREPKLT